MEEERVYRQGDVVQWNEGEADITGLGIPAQDTTYNIFTGASAGTAGTAGLVPIPAAGYQGTFLKGDGTWTSEPVVAADTLVLNCIAD